MATGPNETDWLLRYGLPGAVGAFLLKLFERLFKREERLSRRFELRFDEMEKRIGALTAEVLHWQGRAMAAEARLASLQAEILMLRQLLSCPFSRDDSARKALEEKDSTQGAG